MSKIFVMFSLQYMQVPRFTKSTFIYAVSTQRIKLT